MAIPFFGATKLMWIIFYQNPITIRPTSKMSLETGQENCSENCNFNNDFQISGWNFLLVSQKSKEKLI